jgi:hypothetical protein
MVKRCPSQAPKNFLYLGREKPFRGDSMSFNEFLGTLAVGSRSLTLMPAPIQVPEIEHHELPPMPQHLFSFDVNDFKPRTAAEIMRSAFKNVGDHLYKAMDDVKQKL